MATLRHSAFFIKTNKKLLEGNNGISICVFYVWFIYKIVDVKSIYSEDFERCCFLKHD